MCPAPKMCPNPSDSETCITVEQFFQMRLGVCPGCGTCVESGKQAFIILVYLFVLYITLLIAPIMKNVCKQCWSSGCSL